MAVEVELFGQLATHRPRRQAYVVTRPTTVREVAAALGVAEEDVGLVTIDGIQSEFEDPVPPDGRLCLFPFMTGG